jgi:hypothetical protein
MAPENYNPRSKDYRKPPSDVFSLGMVLSELATGKAPFADDMAASGRWGPMEFHSVVCVNKERPSLEGVDPAFADVRLQEAPSRSRPRANERDEPFPARMGAYLFFARNVLTPPTPCTPPPAQIFLQLIQRCWDNEPSRRPTAHAVVLKLEELYLGKREPRPDELPGIRRLVEVAQRHGIRNAWIPALRNLEAFDIAFICDDSGSMRTNTKVGNKTMTRWEELKVSVKIVAEIAAAVDTDGCDVYFLNNAARPDLKNVTAAKLPELDARMAPGPAGGTPLGETVKRALHDKGFALAGEPRPAASPAKRLLLLIATDGIPDEGATTFVETLEKLPDGVYVQLMPITDDELVTKWMEDCDEKVPNLDSCDDFNAESAQVKAAQGGAFSFSFADYLTKIMLGAIDPFFDMLDGHSVGGVKPLPFPAFPAFNPMGRRMHYRSRGDGSPAPTGGGGGGGGAC